MSVDNNLMAARIFLRAVLPVMKVVLEEDPKMGKKFAGVNAIVQFTADNAGQPYGSHVTFEDGRFGIAHGISDQADIVFAFKSLEKMNAFFAGKPVIPKIKGWFKFGLLLKMISLLMYLKILMPDSDPKDPAKRRIKVKMTFYMITTALSQYNKGGDPEMVKWTSKQPERIYQITVDDTIAAYLRIKAGKSKAGRGTYQRRRPFVHMKFNGVEGAYPIVMNQVDMVTAVRDGLLSIEGAPEYAGNLGDFMQRIQDLIT